MQDVVVSFIGEDKPGLVSKLTETVAAHGGNWEESRMVRLSGQFAGTAKVTIEEGAVQPLCKALEAITDVTVLIRDPVDEAEGGRVRRLRLNIIGPDRPTILRDVSNELLKSDVNVIEMKTRVFAAAMSGTPTFSADADVEAPESVDLTALTDALNRMAEILAVDILLEESGRE